MEYDCLLIDDEDLLSESTREYFNTFGMTSKHRWRLSRRRRK